VPGLHSCDLLALIFRWILIFDVGFFTLTVEIFTKKI